MVGAVAGLGVGVDERCCQRRDRVQPVVLGADRDLVGADGGDGEVDDDLALGLELMTDPAHPDPGRLALVDDGRIAGVA